MPTTEPIRCPACGETTPASVVASLSMLGTGSNLICRCGQPLGEDGSQETPVEVRRLGHYRILEELGSGSFGTVYLAHDENLDRRVALKVPHAHVLGKQVLRDRFVQEGRAVARLQHPCIVRVYEAALDGRVCYIATEFLAGQTLRDLLDAGPLPLDRACWIASELADALAHVHASGIVHRDLKPSNVIVTDGNEVKLIDFGLAHLDTSSITRDHAVMGTATYMSPEQVAGDIREVRAPSDQYNLGAVLYEMLVGSPPYGTDGRFTSLRISQKPRPLREHDPSIPLELEAVVMRTLERVPADRYPTCRALAEELRRWAGSLGRGARAHPARVVPPNNLEAGTKIKPAREKTVIDAPSLMSVSRSVFEETRPDPETLEPPALKRIRPALHELIKSAAERADAESRVSHRFTRDSTNAERKYQARRSDLIRLFETERDRILAAKASELAASQSRLDLALAEATETHRMTRGRVAARAIKSIQDAEESLGWSVVQNDGIRESRRTEETRRRKRWNDEVGALRKRVEACWVDLARMVDRHPKLELNVDPLPPVAPSGRVSPQIVRLQIDATASKIERLVAPPIWARLGSAPALMTRSGQSKLTASYDALRSEIAEAAGAVEALAARVDRIGRKLLDRIERAHDQAVNAFRTRFDEFVLRINRGRDDRLIEVDAAYEATRQRIHDAAQTDSNHLEQVAALEQSHRAALERLDREYAEQTRQIRQHRVEEFAALAERWRSGIETVTGDLAAIEAVIGESFPPWSSLLWEDWAPPAELAPVVRFGSIRVGLDRVPHGEPDDPRLREGVPAVFDWPLLLRFHQRANLLVEAPESAMSQASQVLQATLLRLITTLPAGQIRLTIIDPVGLGGDFGAFHQLADHDELLANLCTETAQIEQALSDLGGHIKKMFRSYFRGDIRTIHEFNRQAQEVAEPVRVLVVAGFPSGFTQVAADWLGRIVERGTQCGVVALVSANPSRSIPGDVTLARLALDSVRLAWRGGRFAWDDPDFGSFPLEIDPPAPPALTAEILHRVGVAAIDARRVQIPFDLVVPPRDLWWTADSRSGFEVPLGKAGPSKLQAMSLGRGTAQHVLIAGRTGSGKSSLLHALITNLALTYHPESLELFLIDFKKGVEFNVYANLELPHARVIAIESEREFGISVLQRLDRELKERGERFREVGAQDLKGYRSHPGLPPLPRILLIVDEFQEFFVGDDPLAAEAALLLDRLVRQGRAFGVHILLGSQSLSGAYSMASGTFGQMSVRIALQCSEADSRVILSEDNGAARLLSRSGEAIYNDANGLTEGNRFFQVVWQPEDVREGYLRQIRELAREHRWEPVRPPIIFEGNAPAVLSKNLDLRDLLLMDSPVLDPPNTAVASLGESVAITGPTTIRLRRVTGDNFLIVGQDGTTARGILASALLSLAAQHPVRGESPGRFWIVSNALDDPDTPNRWSRAWDVPSAPVRQAGRAEVAALLSDLAELVRDRVERRVPDDETHYLLIDNIASFRALHRPEDDFSLDDRGADTPANTLTAILKDGAAVGVHAIVWCDSLTNLGRTIDRSVRREFTLKAILQMSSNDSIHFLDSPAASRLGYHRAILSDETQGRAEKFRPYGLPDTEWLAWAREQLRLPSA